MIDEWISLLLARRSPPKMRTKNDITTESGKNNSLLTPLPNSDSFLPFVPNMAEYGHKPFGHAHAFMSLLLLIILHMEGEANVGTLSGFAAAVSYLFPRAIIGPVVINCVL
ncbi:hypothetical protein SLA2020_486220 [Shorea laevis]